MSPGHPNAMVSGRCEAGRLLGPLRPGRPRAARAPPQEAWVRAPNVRASSPWVRPLRAIPRRGEVATPWSEPDWGENSPQVRALTVTRSHNLDLRVGGRSHPSDPHGE